MCPPLGDRSAFRDFLKIEPNIFGYFSDNLLSGTMGVLNQMGMVLGVALALLITLYIYYRLFTFFKKQLPEKFVKSVENLAKNVRSFFFDDDDADDDKDGKGFWDYLPFSGESLGFGVYIGDIGFI